MTGSLLPIVSPMPRPSFTRQAAWVAASWTAWGVFVGAGAWLQEVLPTFWSIIWFPPTFLALGVLASLLTRWLRFRDRTVANLAAGAAVGGLAGAIAGGLLGTGLGPRLLFGSVGLASGLISGLVFSLTGLMVVHLGLLRTARLLHEGMERDRGPG